MYGSLYGEGLQGSPCSLRLSRRTSQLAVSSPYAQRGFGFLSFSFHVQHFIGQREEFETARDSILVWLTEMDLQLTNIEHFSECDVQAKIKQLKVRS